MTVPKRLWAVLRHPVSRNVLALYWVQIATFVVPIVTLPYVARVLEPSSFGLVVFAQGFAFVLVVFIDWGLGLTGVRSTAERQTDPDGLSDVVHRVRGGQLVLTMASAVLAIAALLVVPTMARHPEFLLLAWVAGAATGLSPGWFFLGIERMRVIALVQLGFRVLAAALTFVLVKDPGDAWVVMALFAASAVGSLAVSDVLMYRRVAFRLPSWRLSVTEIRRGTMIFIGSFAVTMYTSFNVVLLGLFEPSAGVAHFGAAERLVRVAIQLLGPIGGAVIPRITALQATGNRERARRLLTIAVGAAAIPALALTLGLIVLAPWIIQTFYGERFVDETVPILRVLALIIPINVTGVVFGLWLITLHRDRLIVRIVVIAGIANVVLGCILTPAFGPVGMAWAVIAAEGAGALGGFLAIRRDARRARLASGSVPELSHETAG